MSFQICFVIVFAKVLFLQLPVLTPPASYSLTNLSQQIACQFPNASKDQTINFFYPKPAQQRGEKVYIHIFTTQGQKKGQGELLFGGEKTVTGACVSSRKKVTVGKKVLLTSINYQICFINVNWTNANTMYKAINVRLIGPHITLCKMVCPCNLNLNKTKEVNILASL